MGEDIILVNLNDVVSDFLGITIADRSDSVAVQTLLYDLTATSYPTQAEIDAELANPTGPSGATLTAAELLAVKLVTKMQAVRTNAVDGHATLQFPLRQFTTKPSPDGFTATAGETSTEYIGRKLRDDLLANNAYRSSIYSLSPNAIVAVETALDNQIASLLLSQISAQLQKISPTSTSKFIIIKTDLKASNAPTSASASAAVTFGSIAFQVQITGLP